MKQVIVGIAGRARSGKDVLASALVKDHGFVRHAFADALKEEVADFLGIDVEELERRKTELRPALQLRGTEYWRTREPRHWIDELARRTAGVERVVVPDVRFPNEAEWIRQQGGIVVKVAREGGPAREGDGHASESGVDGIIADVNVTEPWFGDFNATQSVFAWHALCIAQDVLR